jgi:hypothetical protein
MDDKTLSEQIANLHLPTDNVWQMRRINACSALAHRERLLREELLAALQYALEFIDDQADVRDGSDGQQLPNRAMALAGELRAVISKALGGSHV